MTSRLRIDLGALAANYRKLVSCAYADVAGVVKANGYGLGAPAVADRLWREQCRSFFVATAEEGVALRQSLPSAQIYVLEGALSESLEELQAHGLVPILNTPHQCELWLPSSRPAGLHVDTGMQRLGIAVADIPGVLTPAGLRIELLVTHLARADEPGHAFNRAQLVTARDVYRGLTAVYPNLKFSLTNSAGMLQRLGPEHLGRAGIALYGGNPYSDRANPMEAVVTFEAQVLQIRRVPAETPVGYGGTFVAPRESRIATVGAGYADGIPRLLSSRGRVWFAGAYCPIVGRVSMDMLHIDVTDIGVNEGDWVELFGVNLSVDEVAEHAETLSYEIFTGLGPRPSRQYLN